MHALVLELCLLGIDEPLKPLMRDGGGSNV